jgi:hypothetical protein
LHDELNRDICAAMNLCSLTVNKTLYQKQEITEFAEISVCVTNLERLTQAIDVVI